MSFLLFRFRWTNATQELGSLPLQLTPLVSTTFASTLTPQGLLCLLETGWWDLNRERTIWQSCILTDNGSLKITLIFLHRVLQKLHLDIQMGEHSLDRSSDRTKDNMETLENSLRHLIDQMMYITKQQEYQRVSKHLILPRYDTWTSNNNKFRVKDRNTLVTTQISALQPQQDVMFVLFTLPSFRRKRTYFGTSVRTPTAKCSGGPWCRPLSCCRSASGRWSDSKTSSSPRSWSDDDEDDLQPDNQALPKLLAVKVYCYVCKHAEMFINAKRLFFFLSYWWHGK